VYSCFQPHRYGEYRMSSQWDHTVLPATRQRQTFPAFNPSRSWYSIYRLQSDERLSWPEQCEWISCPRKLRNDNVMTTWHARRVQTTRPARPTTPHAPPEEVRRGLKNGLLETADKVYGDGRTNGRSQYRETWWWNDEVAKVVEEKRRLFKIWKNQNVKPTK